MKIIVVSLKIHINTNRHVERDHDIHLERVRRKTEIGQTKERRPDGPKTDEGQTVPKMLYQSKKDIFLDILDQDQDMTKIRPRYTWRDQDQVQHASLHALSTNACRLQ